MKTIEHIVNAGSEPQCRGCVFRDTALQVSYGYDCALVGWSDKDRLFFPKAVDSVCQEKRLTRTASIGVSIKEILTKARSVVRSVASTLPPF